MVYGMVHGAWTSSPEFRGHPQDAGRLRSWLHTSQRKRLVHDKQVHEDLDRVACSTKQNQLARVSSNALSLTAPPPSLGQQPGLY